MLLLALLHAPHVYCPRARPVERVARPRFVERECVDVGTCLGFLHRALRAPLKLPG